MSEVAVSSWRDGVSTAAQSDLDGLLEPAWDFAETLLKKHGEFYPFAVAVERNGQQQMIAVHDDINQPDAAEAVPFLIAGLTQSRSELRAAAIAADVRLPEDGIDAIRLTMEHVEGVSLEILIPYRLRRFPRSVLFEEMSVSDAEATIWAD